MVLIAALATAAGQRAPLAKIADEVFGALVRELEEQGLGHKVIADMLGIALRTYHRRTARLSGSDTDPGQTLWEAVLKYVREAGPVPRAEVLRRFALDNELVVRSVLRDLVDSGLVYQAGRGDSTTYRAGNDVASSGSSTDAVDHLLLVAIHQNGPVTAPELAAIVRLEPAAFAASLDRLCEQGLVTRDGSGESSTFKSGEVVIPLGAAVGWEAAVFDHYQAMVTAFVTKLRLGSRRASLSDKIGGSTFAFDLWDGHPFTERVLGFLQSVREQGMSLRAELLAYNREHPRPPDAPWMRVTSYVGQTMKHEVEEENHGADG